jgi:hypothetical protein
MREDAASLLDQRRPVLADAAAHRLILGENSRRFVAHDPSQTRNVRRRVRSSHHAIERPRKIDRRRPRSSQPLGRDSKCLPGRREILHAVREGERKRHRGGHTDRRGAAHGKGRDRAAHLVHRSQLSVYLANGQAALVENPHRGTVG